MASAIAGAGACAHTTTYEEQQQAQFYSAILADQAQASQAAQASQGTAAATADATAIQAQQQAALAVTASSRALPADASSSGAAGPAATKVGTPVASGAVVARIDGQPISAAELSVHQTQTDLPRPDALSDLVDLTLLRRAATRLGMVVAPGALTPEARAELERTLAEKLALDLPPERLSLLVDHAWVKNASTFAERATARKVMDTLRARAIADEPIPVAFKRIGAGANAADWHIGDHEEYPVQVVPAAARGLAAGSVSAVISADGGLHLFKILERRRTPPPAATVHAAVRNHLLEGKTIEILDASAL